MISEALWLPKVFANYKMFKYRIDSYQVVRGHQVSIAIMKCMAHKLQIWLKICVMALRSMSIYHLYKRVRSPKPKATTNS